MKARLFFLGSVAALAWLVMAAVNVTPNQGSGSGASVSVMSNGVVIAASATNNIVANNTFVDLPGVAFNGGLFTYQQGTASKFLWVNNLVVNCGTGNSGAPSCAVIRGDGTTITFDYNLLDAGTLGSTNLLLLSDNGAVFTPFVQAHSRNASITFPFYGYLNPANDYHLLAINPLAIGTGTNMSAYYNTDFDGVTRGQWDIGAYAYAAAGGLKSTTSGRVTHAGRISK